MKIQHFTQKFSIYLFSIFVLNIIISPFVYAATNQSLSKGQSYAVTLLGLVIITLFIYLFFVIFNPEKF